MRLRDEPVPRVGRVLDVIGMLLVAGGAVVYGYSWVGLRGMDAYARPEGAPLFAAIARANELTRIGRVGLALVAAGIVVAVTAAVVARVVRARERDMSP